MLLLVLLTNGAVSKAHLPGIEFTEEGKELSPQPKEKPSILGHRTAATS